MVQFCTLFVPLFASLAIVAPIYAAPRPPGTLLLNPRDFATIEADLATLDTQVTALDTSINAFPNTGGTIFQALVSYRITCPSCCLSQQIQAIHEDAQTLAASLATATAEVNVRRSTVFSLRAELNLVP